MLSRGNLILSVDVYGDVQRACLCGVTVQRDFDEDRAVSAHDLPVSDERDLRRARPARARVSPRLQQLSLAGLSEVLRLLQRAGARLKQVTHGLQRPPEA